MPDYRFDDRPCPDCGHHPTRWRDCTYIGCRNGQVDLYEEDAILHPYGRGQKYGDCPRCKGAGRDHWCPECGADLTHRDDLEEPMQHTR